MYIVIDILYISCNIIIQISNKKCIKHTKKDLLQLQINHNKLYHMLF
jgi:hypothetical protein